MALTWLVGIAEWETWGVHDVDCEAPWQIATCWRVVFFFPSFYNSSFPHPFFFPQGSQHSWRDVSSDGASRVGSDGALEGLRWGRPDGAGRVSSDEAVEEP